jgi:hypothetical protein
LWLKPNSKLETVALQKVDSANGGRGYQIAFDESEPIPGLKRGSHLLFRLIHRSPGDAIEIATRERLALGSWYNVVINYDGSGKASGLKIYVDAKPAEIEVQRDSLTGSIQNASSFEIGASRSGRPYKGQMDDLRIYNRTLSDSEIARLAFDQPTRATLALLAAKRSKDQKARLREYFLTYDAPENFRKIHTDLKNLTAEKERLEDVIPTSMIMDEMEKPRATAVLGRGDYRNRGEKVSPGVPAALPPLPKDAPLNRLTLARWLVNPQHPLTARVAVNRYWQMYFGIGIVKTAEDFGSQGEAPVHRELLDWLATEFIRTGWDVKAMQRLIVTSATYRQSSRTTPDLVERDPENRLLARGPRFRLPAEMVRDNALAVSGLLNEKVGGPGVFPYQPKGLWEDIAYGDVYSAQTYNPSYGPDLYRRSMYSFWKRTSPPPGLITFDAPDREKCTARRTLTNTPLQALALMNDPTYIEAARTLAQRMLTEAGPSMAKRIDFAFRLATDRKPASKELRVLTDLAKQELADYRRNQDAALKLLSVGESKPDPKLKPVELAAWTTVASTILNLDETITKE